MKEKSEIIISSLDELTEIGKQLLAFADDRKKWCFYGEVGAGKTTLIKAIGGILQVQEAITSPTYGLVNEYTYIEHSQEKKLYHLDLYRLNQIEEALDIGIEDYLYDNALCFIEWPELVEAILPLDVVRIRLEITDKNNRRIAYR